MRCPYCGKELITGTIRCDGCGASIDSNQTQNNETNNDSSYSQNYSNKSSNKSGILIMIVFLLGFGLLAYFVLFSGGSSDKESNKESNNESSQKTNNNKEQDKGVVQKSRDEAYARTGAAYIDAIRYTISSSSKLKLYSTSTVYLLPVGDDKKCGNVESGGSSPYGKEWNYAYVAVTYNADDYTYNYSFIAEDNMNYGFALTSYDQLLSDGSDRVYKNYSETSITQEISNKLSGYYSIEENVEVNFTSDPELKSVLAANNSNIKKAIFISSSNGCKS